MKTFTDYLKNLNSEPKIQRLFEHDMFSPIRLKNQKQSKLKPIA